MFGVLAMKYVKIIQACWMWRIAIGYSWSRLLTSPRCLKTTF